MSVSDDRRVTARDIADLSANLDTNFRVVAPDPAKEGVLLEGEYRLTQLRPGLVLHSSDAHECFDLDTEAVVRDGLTAYLFLDGDVEATIGDRPLNVGRCGREIEAVVCSRARPDLFHRHSHRGAHIRKVTVGVNEEWLENSGFNDTANHHEVKAFARDHLAQARWRPSARLIALAEQILHPPPYSGPLQALYLESRALEILTEALLAINHAETRYQDAGLGTRDHARLRAICDFLDAHVDEALTLGEIAAYGKISPNTLQRLFQSAYGVTVFDYFRARKLDLSRARLERDGISVTEAAFLAGYSSSANFATAFKRRFGVSPKHLRAKL